MIRVFKWIANLLLIVVIILLSSYLVLRVTNKIEIYNVKTGSMEAKIHVGDYILIYKKNNYNIGDVVTYTSNNGFITHRIIRKDGDKIVTKGDANNTEDETISAKTIVGKVIMSGGILNFVIKYKYVLSVIVLSLYLFSCYFESDKKAKLEINDEINDNVDNDFLQIEVKEKKDSKNNFDTKTEENKMENKEEFNNNKNNINNKLKNETKNKIKKENKVVSSKKEEVKKNKTKKKIEK